MSELEQETAGFVCDVCGESFDSKQKLGQHRRSAHGIASERNRGSSEKSPKRGRGGSRQERRAKLLRETIDEWAKFSDEVKGQSTEPPSSLAQVIRKDADRIADSLSWLAERLTPLGLLVDKTMGHGGIISIARGFAGVGRYGIRKWRETMQARQEQREQEPEEVFVDVEQSGDELNINP